MLFILDTGKGKPRESLDRVGSAGLASLTTTLLLCCQWYSINLSERVNPVRKSSTFCGKAHAGHETPSSLKKG
jgi:hypothetical protein